MYPPKSSPPYVYTTVFLGPQNTFRIEIALNPVHELSSNYFIVSERLVLGLLISFGNRKNPQEAMFDEQVE